MPVTPDDRPDGRSHAGTTEPSVYAGVGLAGIVLLVAGIWYPVLQPVPDGAYLRLVLAVLGGILAAYGWSRWYDGRQGPRRGVTRRPNRSPTSLPSLEIYSPEAPEPSSDQRRAKVAHVEPRPASSGGAGRRPRRVGAVRLVGLSFLALLLLLPGSAVLASAVPSGSSAGHPSATPTTSTAPPVPVRGPFGTPPVPSCSVFYPPAYATVNGFYPPLPKYSLQSPCKTSHDEAYLTFSSSGASSGDNFRVPLYLPNSGNPGQSTTYGDFYLGMVVQGNPSSVDSQSYAELEFSPHGVGGLFTWHVGVAVWSLVLNTACTRSGGFAAGLNLSYQNEFGCVVNEVNRTNGTVLESIPGGQWANVTFIGSPTLASGPLSVYFNDSTNPAHSTSYTFTAAHTGTNEFRPWYSVACPTACILNWSTPFGLGVGVDLCENPPVCFSYNGTTQLGAPPVEVGSPEYWTGLNYSGDYRYLGPVSSTGACGGQAAVVPCDALALAGQYPFFSFNGTALNFGTNWSWTTEDWGGAAFEFNAYGTINQETPLFLDQLTNSSRVGLVAPGTPLNVSVRVQDLGRIAIMNLSYTQPGSASVNESMTLLSGNASDGYYNATIPSDGANGTVAYRVWATNRAGAVVALPESGTPNATVNRTTIPYVNVTLETLPSGCGGLSLGGGAYSPNGTSVNVLAGYYSIRTNGCYPYHFVRWTTTGGLAVQGSGTSAELAASSNGTVEARWAYYRPTDTIGLAWSPSACGVIDLNGSAYLAGTVSSVFLLDAGSYALGASACAGYSFSGWTVSNSAHLSILGPTLDLHGNGTLTALFVLTSSAALVGFETNPAYCGGVLLRGVGYVSGESVSLPTGSYPIQPDPCGGWGFAGVDSTTGSVAISGDTLTVSGPGVVTYTYYKLTLVTVLTVPSTCGGILWDGIFEAGGTVLNVTNHTQHSLGATPCGGTYLEGFATTGGVSLSGTTVVVDAPGSIEAVFHSGTPHYFVGFQTQPGTCGVITFDGTGYTNSQFVSVPPGTVATLNEAPCAGYGFVGWTTSGGIQVAGSLAYVNQSGSIAATFHPLVNVVVYTTPSSCGSVTIAGQSFSNNGSGLFPEGATFSIVATPCASQTLSTWQVSAGASIANGTLTLSGASTITAVFAPAVYTVRLLVDAGGCGQVSLGSVAYGNNSTVSLTSGAYPLAPQLCAGYEFVRWAANSNLTVTGSVSATLTVAGSGVLTLVGAAVPPSVALAAPTDAAKGSSVVFVATVAVPVPPYNYSYTWAFGDGASVTVPSNTTSHVFSSTGTYLVRVSVVDPLGRGASAEANVTVVLPSSGPTFGLGTTGLVVLGVAVAVVVIGAVVVAIRSRRARPEEGAPAPLDEPPAGPA